MLFRSERTPNRPAARGTFHGISHSNFTRENIARAAIEGVIAGMVYATKALERCGVQYSRVLLIGGAAKNPAVQSIAASIFGSEITVPPSGEYVANGAARQAAWALTGKLPQWQLGASQRVNAEADNETLESYLELIASI